MITPMIAAYFLAAQGEQKHAEGPWIDRYERLLRWTLDSDKHQARRARYDRVRTRLAFLWVPIALAPLSLLFSLFQYFQPVPALHRPPHPARKSVVWVKPVSERVDLGGRSIFNTKRCSHTEEQTST